MAKRLLSGIYLVANVCCSVFYLLFGGNVCGEAVVGAGGLVMLIVCAALAVSLLRGKNPVLGTAKCATVFLGLAHLFICLCWLRWFPSYWAGPAFHGALFLFSGGYLYWLIRESGTASFWRDYEFHPWEKERA